jgi:hypothetical protein
VFGEPRSRSTTLTAWSQPSRVVAPWQWSGVHSVAQPRPPWSSSLQTPKRLLTSSIYKPGLVPSLQEHNPNCSWYLVLMGDSAAFHKAKLSAAFLSKSKVDKISNWPPQSHWKHLEGPEDQHPRALPSKVGQWDERRTQTSVERLPTSNNSQHPCLNAQANEGCHQSSWRPHPMVKMSVFSYFPLFFCLFLSLSFSPTPQLHPAYFCIFFSQIHRIFFPANDQKN